MNRDHHGTWSGYSYWRCRCDACRAANKRMCAETRERRYALRFEIDGRLVNPQANHGTEGGYKNWGCRCLPCVAAHSVAMAARRSA